MSEQIYAQETKKKKKLIFLYKILFKKDIVIIGTKPPSNYGSLIKRKHGFFTNVARRRRERAPHFSSVA